VAATPDLAVDIDALCRALSARSAATVVVSEEVGLGVHPPTDVGRRFRDVLGDVNRAVGDLAAEVLLVVAGRVLRLDEL
jgi:adenosyl cobinamide kinase/adenosyl cobinamide phosphate guanylyltransferase